MKKFTFFLDFLIEGQFVGLLWALEKGLYKEAGLDVEFVEWVEDGRSIIQKVIDGGRLCAGCSEDNLIISACAAGLPVRALATMLQVSPLVLMTKHSSGIQTIRDLIGKKVAMHCDGIRILEAVLALEKIPTGAVEIHELPYQPDRLVRDEFQAVQGYAMYEPLQLAAMGVDVQTLPVRHHHIHPYAQVFFATLENIEQEPVAIQSFLSASLEGFRQSVSQRDEAAKIVAKFLGGRGDVASARKVIDQLIPYLYDEAGDSRYGALDLERWSRNLKTYAAIGLTSGVLAVEDTVDNHFIERIYGYPP
ncbi:MAG: ABC transporter substrate-binding protein [Anaerolineae bacterium]|nr:ABC transporter substrate-binding protein [Anaerolineae bacterium]